MRNFILAMTLLLTTAAACAAEAPPAPELLRIPLIAGLYTVEAPATWRLEESGKDLTATFSKAADAPAADGTLIIAAPNPLIRDAAAYNRKAAESLLKTFDNGTITKEESTTENGRPAHTIWFAFKAGHKAFLGWSRTMEFPESNTGINAPVQAMALASMSAFAEFMKTAEPILASCELHPAMLQENTDLLTEVGQKILAAVEN